MFLLEWPESFSLVLLTELSKINCPYSAFIYFSHCKSFPFNSLPCICSCYSSQRLPHTRYYILWDYLFCLKEGTSDKLLHVVLYINVISSACAHEYNSWSNVDTHSVKVFVFLIALNIFLQHICDSMELFQRYSKDI